MSNDEIAALLAESGDASEEGDDIPEEIRFSFFDVQTGQLIGETGDVDIITMPGDSGQYAAVLERLAVLYRR